MAILWRKNNRRENTPTFVIENFSELFLQPSTFLIEGLRPK